MRTEPIRKAVMQKGLLPVLFISTEVKETILFPVNILHNVIYKILLIFYGEKKTNFT